MLNYYYVWCDSTANLTLSSIWIVCLLISVPPWKIKQCTLVKRNLLGGSDYPHSVCVCISQAKPHPPVDIFPKKILCSTCHIFIFNVFAGGAHCVCAFVGSVLLLWRLVENDYQSWHSKQQCGAILSASFYQTIYSFLVLDSGEWGKENLPSNWLSTCAEVRGCVCAFISMGESELWY